MQPEDVLEFVAVQDRSYARAGPGIRESYPKHLAMGPGELAAFLGSKQYALLATSRPDGRPQASPIGFFVWRASFWVASVRGARVRNLRSRPYASIVIAEGEPRKNHRAVIAEGPVTLYEGSQADATKKELLNAWREKHGSTPDWASALIQLHPERLFSFDGTREQTSTNNSPHKDALLRH